MRGKLRFIIGGLVVLVIAGSLIGLGLWQQSEYEWQAEYQAAENARYADQDIKARCVPLAAIDERNCTIEARREQRRYERDEHDLYAQKTTAFWTFLMGSAAIIGMMLSSIGVWLVYTTFGETRAANKIAQDAQRAWIRLSAIPKLVRQAGLNGLYIRTDFIAENTGHSAATHFTLYHRIFFRPYGEAGDELAKDMLAQVNEWKEDHSAKANMSLLPNDREVSCEWKSFTEEEVKWKEKAFVGPVAQPMLLTATIYRTVFEPRTLQVSWRTWYLVALDDDGQSRACVPKPELDEPFGPNDLYADPFHMSMFHEELPAQKDRQEDAEQN